MDKLAIVCTIQGIAIFLTIISHMIDRAETRKLRERIEALERRRDRDDHLTLL
jgi:hypothetical protein